MKLHEYANKVAHDLAYKAPELWPPIVAALLDDLGKRYPDVDEITAVSE